MTAETYHPGRLPPRVIMLVTAENNRISRVKCTVWREIHVQDS